jgi:hypothetical protein
VLDDIERGRFLVKPAGKDPLELALRASDIELDEGAGELLLLPGRGRLAGTQPNDRIADTERLAGLHRQIRLDAIALVQEPDDRDALPHRRGTRGRRDLRLRDVNGHRLRLGLARLIGRHRRPIAPGEQQDGRTGQRTQSRSCWHQSGVHA